MSDTATKRPGLSWSAALLHAKYWRGEVKHLFGVPYNQIKVLSNVNGRAAILSLGGLPSAELEAIQSQTLLRIPIEDGAPSTEPVAFTLLLGQQDAGVDKEKLSEEVLLLHERMRTSLVSGIVSYDVDPATGSIMLATPTQLLIHHNSEHGQSGVEHIAQWFKRPSLLNPSPSPVERNVIAFCSGDQLFVTRGNEKLFESAVIPGISNGSASYIVQEELERYEGFWWSPTRLELLYERVDESAVQELSFVPPGSASTQPMRYPLAGTTNPTSTLRVCSVGSDGKVKDGEVKADLKGVAPWMEYISRIGWLPDGESAYVVVMDRVQSRMALLLLPRTVLVGESSSEEASIRLLYEESCPKFWINWNNLLSFLPMEEDGKLRLILGSEKFDHCHLFLHTYTLNNRANNGGCDTVDCLETRITGKFDGDSWEVIKEALLVVDTRHQHVYYLGNKVSPLILSLCVSSYGPSTAQNTTEECALLTPGDLCYKFERRTPSLMLNPEVGFVCWLSSTDQPPRCLFYRLVHPAGGGLPTSAVQFAIDIGISSPMAALPPSSVEPMDDDQSRQIPLRKPFAELYRIRVFAYESQNSGKTHYALLVWPKFGDSGGNPTKKFPVIQLVYAGPSVQLVRNSWYSFSGLLKYVSLGYAVLLVDGRGSSNRGVQFEGALKERMGTVEVEDQAEGFRIVAAQMDCIDVDRVGVMGWSYGGYMSMLLLAHHPEIYKAACVGGAVSDWNLYDTGYTERWGSYPTLGYMGLPQQNEQAYKACGLDGIYEKLPNEEGRLLIIHGLIDENVHFTHTTKILTALVEAGKPHQLLIFPKERHGIRGKPALDYRDAQIFTFFDRALQP